MQLRVRSGYSLGVAGVVLDGDRVLFVRRMHEPNLGRWTFPSGWVMAQEPIEEAVLREVEEETGLQTQVVGVIGLRNRVSPNDNNLVINFLLRPLAGEPAPDMVEVDGARYFPFAEALEDPDVIELNRLLVLKILAGDYSLFVPIPCPPTPALPGRYSAFY